MRDRIRFFALHCQVSNAYFVCVCRFHCQVSNAYVVCDTVINVRITRLSFRQFLIHSLENDFLTTQNARVRSVERTAPTGPPSDRRYNLTCMRAKWIMSKWAAPLTRTSGRLANRSISRLVKLTICLSVGRSLRVYKLSACQSLHRSVCEAYDLPVC